MAGPNTLSFNSHAAVSPIYSSAQALNKSNAYIPGHMHGSGLFFIQDRDEHSVRRRHWAPAFKPGAVQSYKPGIEKRVNEMMETIERRQKPVGWVSLSDMFAHWSYDVMVCQVVDDMTTEADTVTTQGDLTFGNSSKLVSSPCKPPCSVRED